MVCSPSGGRAAPTVPGTELPLELRQPPADDDLLLIAVAADDDDSDPMASAQSRRAQRPLPVVIGEAV